MQEFVANRMSSGNRLFPDKVTISDIGITLRSAGFLNGKEKTIHYHEIISVESDSPMMGFSTIKFKCIFDSIICKGFTKEQVEEMKQIVNRMVMQLNSGSFNQPMGMNMAAVQQMNQTQASHVAQMRLETENKERELRLERERIEMDKKKQKEERADKLRKEGRNFHAFVVEYDNAIIGTIVTLSMIIFLLIIANKPK